jgi:hypothetical protein
MTMALDELFAVSPNKIPPEVRRWEALARGRRMECEFLRRRDGLAWEPARIQITFPGTDLPPEQTVLWDLAIDDWLLSHSVRAVSPQNETERFGFRLDALFEPIENRYGDGYFNSVLVTYLKGSDFATRPNLGEKLVAVHAYRPHASQAADDCRERIVEVLKATARTLDVLYPDRAVAETVLCDALAYYLDDRFNISTRAMLGWA